MTLSYFSVENYKSFSRKQDIEIKPLTFFFGWNSGGKSSLVRFLPLISESIEAGSLPIWLAGAVGREATWPELVCKASERNNLKISFRWSGDIKASAEWEILGGIDGSWQHVKSLSYEGDNIDQCFTDDSCEKWKGIFPVYENRGHEYDYVNRLKELVEGFCLDTQWISGIRSSLPRILSYSGGTRAKMQHDGSDAANHLVNAVLRSTADPIIEAVQEFFIPLGEKLVLDNPADGVWRVLLHPKGAPSVQVNLRDTGEGYSQVLPVLVALARARFGGPKILCLEQPELHLHTRAQVQLAQTLVRTAKDKANPLLLVETHSEVLLTSIQLAIVSGEISPDMVRVYWVESRNDGTSEAVPIDFNEDGQPSNTVISNAFREAISLGQSLAFKQIEKGAL
ncbi:AAA family ATPase [Azospirillum sp. B21]|uniref:AAA family ATPase n=1 Tax=Azospirillum sp. B21 TaxID=2607496 RepID=UPI0011EEC6CF|nr:AAA family ATPase [Azospirillum sp. B21]KAA0578877.1 AAA family ATPase [Azospirillum sp. B21]